ncbi:MAG: hypothetical protein ACJAWV_004472 [Flammeovirgaceae bacterium]|jgi:hypothetical protein
MAERDKQLLSIRIEVPRATISEDSSQFEHFQNTTLRPIIKFQHELIIQIANSKLKKKQKEFQNLSEQKQKEYLENLLMRDNNFRQEMVGIIVGFFTSEEYGDYAEMKSEINRRIIQIIKQRLWDSLGELVIG